MANGDRIDLPIRRRARVDRAALRPGPGAARIPHRIANDRDPVRIDPRAHCRTGRRTPDRGAAGRQCRQSADARLARASRRRLPDLRPGHDRAAGQELRAARVGQRLQSRRVGGRCPRRSRTDVSGVRRRIVWRRGVPPARRDCARSDRSGRARRTRRPDRGSVALDAVARCRISRLPIRRTPGPRRGHGAPARRARPRSLDGRVNGAGLPRNSARHGDAAAGHAR